MAMHPLIHRLTISMPSCSHAFAPWQGMDMATDAASAEVKYSSDTQRKQDPQDPTMSQGSVPMTKVDPAARQRGAQLTRLQRTLGLKRLSKPEKGKKTPGCTINREFDPVKSTGFPFEQNVMLVAFYMEVEKGDNDELRDMNVGVARLDTAVLENLAPGSDGEIFTKKVFASSCSLTTPEGASELSIARIRRSLAFAFERGNLRGCFAEDVVSQGTNLILVTHDREQLFSHLAAFGLDPKQHMGLLDIVDVLDIGKAFGRRAEMLAHKRRDMSTLDSQTKHRDPSCFDDCAKELHVDLPIAARMGKGPYCRKMAAAMLEIVIKYAIKDIQEHAGRQCSVGGNGGCFPGPYRKLESVQEKFAYRAERILSLRRDFTAKQIQDILLKLLKAASESSDTPTTGIRTFNPLNDCRTHGLGSSYENILEQLDIPITLPKNLVRQSRTEHIFGLHVPGDLNDLLDSLATASDDTEVNQKSLANMSTIMPANVRAARTAYHNAARAFVDRIVAIPKSAFNVACYTRTVVKDNEYGYYRETFITPPEKYVALAKALRDKASSSIQYNMVEALHKEIAGRKLVDDWYAGLSGNNALKDMEKMQKHDSFRKVLEETLGILIETLIPRIPALEPRLMAVADRIRSNA